MPAVHFSNEDFKEKVIGSDKPVLVDFYAEWCGPCKMAAPIVDELADQYAGKILIGKVDVDQAQQVAAEYGVMSIPTMIVFKDGKEVERKVGFGGRPGVEALIEKIIQ